MVFLVEVIQTDTSGDRDNFIGLIGITVLDENIILLTFYSSILVSVVYV